MFSFDNYKKWINKKFKISTLERVHQIHEGEVYWCSLGLNIGDEENGNGEDFRRPVLVIKKFNNNIFWGIPLSTKIKDSKYYIKVTLRNETVSAMISQLRIIDSQRLDDKIGYIKKSDLKNIKIELTKLLN